MSHTLEIESKSMINKEDYKSLISAYKNVKTYKQINYYISSDEILKKIKDYGLRIRTKNHKYELTLKVTEKVGRLEINQEITRKSLLNLKYFGKFPSGEVEEYLKKNNVCDVTKLRIIGKLITIRTDIKFDSSLISIDKSKYNGKIDYEIECENESIEQTEIDLKKFLDKHNISYQKSEHNKLARFLNSLR